MEIKQNDETSSSVLIQVFEERCKYQELLENPHLLENELPNMSDEQKIEIYRFAMVLSKEPRDIKDLLWFSIFRLEDEEAVQMYLDRKSKKEKDLEDDDKAIIDEIIANLNKRKKEKSMFKRFLKCFKP